MTLEQIFKIANTFALVAWIALVFLPRGERVIALYRYGAIGLLVALYVTLLIAFSGNPSEVDFTTLGGIKALFAKDEAVLAGWVHYLALDLFAGVWLAERFDAKRISRFVQAPILAATFISGPFGLLLGYLALGAFKGVRARE
jgi:hypothetical protein